MTDPYPAQQPYPPEPHPAAPYQPVYSAVFRKQTGMLIMAQTTPVQAVGSYADVRSAFWKAQTHCLLLGWWGILSLFIYNPMSLIHNINELGKVKAAARANGEPV